MQAEQQKTDARLRPNPMARDFIAPVIGKRCGQQDDQHVACRKGQPHVEVGHPSAALLLWTADTPDECPEFREPHSHRVSPGPQPIPSVKNEPEIDRLREGRCGFPFTALKNRSYPSPHATACSARPCRAHPAGASAGYLGTIRSAHRGRLRVRVEPFD